MTQVLNIYNTNSTHPHFTRTRHTLHTQYTHPMRKQYNLSQFTHMRTLASCAYYTDILFTLFTLLTLHIHTDKTHLDTKLTIITY